MGLLDSDLGKRRLVVRRVADRLDLSRHAPYPILWFGPRGAYSLIPARSGDKPPSAGAVKAGHVFVATPAMPGSP